MVVEENRQLSKQSKRRGNGKEDRVAKRRNIEEEINLQQTVKFENDRPGHTIIAQNSVEGAECPREEEREVGAAQEGEEEKGNGEEGHPLQKEEDKEEGRAENSASIERKKGYKM